MLSSTQAKEIPQMPAVARPMSILIIDDSEIDRQRVMRLCKDAGLSFVATEVDTIAEMRAVLDEDTFDLVFIDYLLAGEDGLDAVDALAAHSTTPPASIMIAGEGRIDIAVEAMRRGCSDYMTKSDMTVTGLQKSVSTAVERQMMGFALDRERALRLALETSVRQYANSCSSEMRSILAATLRRVRKLRTLARSEVTAVEFGALEASIDRLWEALPDFNESTRGALAGHAVAVLPSRPH